ncbi:MAG: hypothetical protein OXK77_12050 [Gemmatimonadota bacterium]|nr:hypothetical protein [Gemmatimonadota bacterium]MDE2864953.1 hypothetical protein [Gemmatimonadota bacterium]MYB04926.1 hypothetical protein [Gemmatimonadota bacterium]MYG21434.1 hypothetical protein [Gemmatimonadota bacterium]MYJ40052.1 hypothetical protein [Gemmatimonadota bacterium]
MTDSPARVSASQVTLILKRAAEIDARGDTLTVEELRRIASEAGIDPAATEAAIDEVMTGEEPAPVPAVQVEEQKPELPVKKSESPSTGWIVASGAVGTAMGFITALPGFLSVPAFGATVMYLMVRAVQSMKRGAQLDFQLQNFAAWLGMALAGEAIGFVSEGFSAALALVLWIVTSGAGGLLVKFGPRDEEADADVPRLGPGKS